MVEGQSVTSRFSTNYTRRSEYIESGVMPLHIPDMLRENLIPIGRAVISLVLLLGPESPPFVPFLLHHLTIALIIGMGGGPYLIPVLILVYTVQFQNSFSVFLVILALHTSTPVTASKSLRNLSRELNA
jgi:hypothetical protein